MERKEKDNIRTWGRGEDKNEAVEKRGEGMEEEKERGSQNEIRLNGRMRSWKEKKDWNYQGSSKASGHRCGPVTNSRLFAVMKYKTRCLVDARSNRKVSHVRAKFEVFSESIDILNFWQVNSLLLLRSLVAFRVLLMPS